MNKLASVINRPKGKEDDEVLREAGLHEQATSKHMMACIAWAAGRRTYETYCVLCDLANLIQESKHGDDQ